MRKRKLEITLKLQMLQRDTDEITGSGILFKKSFFRSFFCESHRPHSQPVSAFSLYTGTNCVSIACLWRVDCVSTTCLLRVYDVSIACLWRVDCVSTTCRLRVYDVSIACLSLFFIKGLWPILKTFSLQKETPVLLPFLLAFLFPWLLPSAP